MCAYWVMFCWFFLVICCIFQLLLQRKNGVSVRGNSFSSPPRTPNTCCDLDIALAIDRFSRFFFPFSFFILNLVYWCNYAYSWWKCYNIIVVMHFSYKACSKCGGLELWLEIGRDWHREVWCPQRSKHLIYHVLYHIFFLIASIIPITII